MFTLKEIFTFLTIRFRGALIYCTRNELREQIKRRGPKILILDVGGRNSPYTCFMQGNYVISDLKRISDLQKQLNLGFTENIINNLKHNRSNIKDVVYDDMTNTNFMPNTFDGVMAIEVIEHIFEDNLFIQNIYKVLKPGGFLILTTPNGSSITNNNPDHIRHYQLEELTNKLHNLFAEVKVDYIVPLTVAHANSLSPWSIKKPFKTIWTMINGLISIAEQKGNKLNKANSVHLMAVAIKG